MIAVRPAGVEDSEAINEIYNWYVDNTIITFDVDPWDIERRRQWVGSIKNPFHLLVAEDENGIVGFACNTRFRPKAAYDSSTEVTIYIKHGNTTKGVGQLLYDALFLSASKTHLHRAYAVIALPNDVSVRFHEKYGFKKIGVLSEVGKKFGKYVDTAWYEKSLT